MSAFKEVAKGGSANRIEFKGDVVRCSCPKTGDPATDLATVTRVHGYQVDGVNLNACPRPGLIEPNAFSMTWKRASLRSTSLIILVFALGMAAALAVHQIWLLMPLLFGAILQVNGGRAIVTNRLRSAGTEPLFGAWGTGAGTTAAGDTTLFTDALVTLAAGTTDHTTGVSTQQTTSTTNDTYQVIFTRTATGAGTVTNAGLYDAASGGNLYMKGDFTGIGLAIGDAIQVTAKVQYT